MLLDSPLSVVTPTLDGDVLGVLASADARFTTGQLHRVLGRFSEHGIRKVLIRLVGQGIVHSERVGNAVAYSLNRQHVAAAPIIELTRARTRLLELVSALVSGWKRQPLFAAVFGSAVHGSMRVDSDIDVMIIHGDGESELEWNSQQLDLQLQIPRWTGNRAEIISMNESEMRERGRDRLLDDVRMFGAQVGGDREWFDRVLRGAERA